LTLWHCNLSAELTEGNITFYNASFCLLSVDFNEGLILHHRN